jgi:NitT/TauT family transport system substrate-binding protein
MSRHIARGSAAKLIAAGIALPWATRTAASAADPETVRIGMLPVEATCVAYYAKDNGYFEKAGLDVSIEVNPSSASVASAVVSGTYDIGYATISTLASAHVKGLPLVIIAPAGIVTPGLVIGGIVAPVRSSIQTAKDLNGKSFAVSGLNTLAEYQPEAWVDKHGGDSSTMRFIEMPLPEIVGALDAGRVDAGYLTEPFLSLGTKRNLVRMLATGNDALAPRYLASAWYATSAWAQAHPEIVSRYAAALAEAGRWANANPAKVVVSVAAHLKVDPVLVGTAMRTTFTDKLVDAQIQPWIDVTAKYAKFPSFPATDLIYKPKA